MKMLFLLLGIVSTLSINAQENNVDIICKDTTSIEMASAYLPHTFSARSDTPIDSYTWIFEIEDLNGNMTPINTSTDSVFIIPSINTPSNYLQNVDGKLNGKIALTAKMGNQTLKKECHLNLEIKPIIISASIDTIIVSPTSDFFSLDLKVIYKGCNSIYYEIEQYDEPSVYTKTLHEPNIAHVKNGGLIIGRRTWIDLFCSNQYGTSIFTYELDPVYHKDPSAINVTISDEASSEIEYLDVFTVQGCFVKRIIDVKDNNLNLEKGIYLLKIKEKGADGLKTQKIAIR